MFYFNSRDISEIKFYSFPVICNVTFKIRNCCFHFEETSTILTNLFTEPTSCYKIASKILIVAEILK